MTDADREPPGGAPSPVSPAGEARADLRLVGGAVGRDHVQPARERRHADDDVIERLALWLVDVTADALEAARRTGAASKRVGPAPRRTR